jgi:hypothetical protein
MEAWMDLIASAQYKPSELEIRGQIVTIERGQFTRKTPTSCPRIAHSTPEGCQNTTSRDSPTRFPIQRMPNISLQPNPAKSSLDDLIDA